MVSPQQTAAQEAARFVETFNNVIIFPTIALLTAVAFLVFIWGCVEYFINSANDTGRQEGVKHITFGIIGLVIMISAFAILNIVANTAGLDEELKCANNPSASGCTDFFTQPSSGGTTGNGGLEGGSTGNGGMGGGSTGNGGL